MVHIAIRDRGRSRRVGRLATAAALGIALLAPSFVIATPAQAIVGGSVVTAPSWAASLYPSSGGGTINNRHVCSGVLVSSTWVLTAAHCFNETPRPDRVVVGRSRLSDAGGTIRVIQETRYLRNSSSHCPSNTPSTQCDVALVRISSVTQTPLQLATSSVASQWGVGTSGRLHGYGSTSSYYGPSSNDHKRTSMSIREFYTTTMGVRASGTTGCGGDSGGPFVVSTSSGWRLVGILREVKVNTLSGACVTNDINSITVVGYGPNTNQRRAYNWIRSII